MFTGFTDETVDFMWGIRFNNEKPWFEAHKETYLRSFYQPMRALLGRSCGTFLDRRPEYGLIAKTTPHLSGRPAAPRPGPLQGPPVVLRGAALGAMDRPAHLLVRAGAGGLDLRHGVLYAPSPDHGQAPRPDRPGPQNHGGADPEAGTADGVRTGDGGLQAPPLRGALAAAGALVPDEELSITMREADGGAVLPGHRGAAGERGMGFAALLRLLRYPGGGPGPQGAVRRGCKAGKKRLY